MTHLVSTDIVVMLSVLASILVILYVVGYAVIGYFQKLHGTLRPDWGISLVFYAGIFVLTVGYLFNLLHACFGTICVQEFFDEAYLLSLVLFAYGFERRAGYAVHLTSQMQKAQKRSKR